MSRKDEIIRLAKAGMTYREIGAAVGVSHVYAQRIASPVVGLRREWRAKFSAEARAAAVDFVRLGMSYSEAAAACGMTRSAVAGACRDARLKACSDQAHGERVRDKETS